MLMLTLGVVEAYLRLLSDMNTKAIIMQIWLLQIDVTDVDKRGMIMNSLQLRRSCVRVCMCAILAVNAYRIIRFATR